MWFEDTWTWKLLAMIGEPGLGSEVLIRKMQHVYVHEAGFLAMVLITFMVIIRRLIKERAFSLSRGGRFTERITLLYVFIGGLLFFNTPVLTHAMLRWNRSEYFLSALYSLGVASFPLALHYLVSAVRKDDLAKHPFIFIAQIPIIHSLMALVYLASPFISIE